MTTNRLAVIVLALTVVISHAVAQAGVISGFTVNNSSLTYTLQADAMANGVTAYSDRTYTWQTVPAYLAGADYVQTPNNDRGNNGVSIDVTLSQASDVYAWFDDRVSTPSWPIWDGWSAIGDQITLGGASGETFSIWGKALAAGDYAGLLGPAEAPGRAMYGFGATPAAVPPVPSGLTTPTAALADLNRSGAGNPFPASGSVGMTIAPWGFPGGDVHLGENPNDLNGGTLAYWYLKPGSQGSGAYPPQSLYYDLGEAMTVDQIHLWWSDRDAPNITGRITDMDIDFLPLSAAQPGTFDLVTMQGLSGWANAVTGYDPSAGSFGVQQDLDPTDFLTQYIRLTMNASGYGGSNGNQWGGLRQIAVTQASAIIPEPSTFLIWSLGLLGLTWYARRRRTK